MWECEWRKFYEIVVSVREHLREFFLHKRPLCQDQWLDKIESGALFDYVQCDIKLPEHLREQFANCQPIFNKSNVYRQDARSLFQEYAKKEGLMTQPQRLVIFGFELTKSTFVTPILMFYLELRLVCTKVYHFFEYTLVKVLTTLCNPLSMLMVKKTRITTPVLLKKLWSCLQRAHMAIKIWIAVAIQLRAAGMIETHMQRSTKKCSREKQISATMFSK